MTNKPKFSVSIEEEKYSEGKHCVSIHRSNGNTSCTAPFTDEELMIIRDTISNHLHDRHPDWPDYQTPPGKMELPPWK